MEILGWGLVRLADWLCENDLATVHALTKRYADLDRARPFVASINITPISRIPTDSGTRHGANRAYKSVSCMG